MSGSVRSRCSTTRCVASSLQGALWLMVSLRQVIETESYVNELLGNPKEKETCVLSPP